MLPEKPDRRKTYYKVTNEKEMYCKSQCEEETILGSPSPDLITRNQCDKCIAFTTKELIHKFLGYGKWIAPVRIPKNAQVILSYKKDKYYADILHSSGLKPLSWYVTHLFDKSTFPIEDYDHLMMYCSDDFDLWYDKEIFPTDKCFWLAKYCTDKIKVWFDKRTFPAEYYSYLEEYCGEYEHIWK